MTVWSIKFQLDEILSETGAPILDLPLTISDGFVSSIIYYKHDDFDLDIVNFPVLDGDIHRATSYAICISQLIRLARVSSHVSCLTLEIKFYSQSS